MVDSAPLRLPDNLPELVEGLLFAAAKPLPLPLLARTLEVEREELEEAVEALAWGLQGRGVRLQRSGDEVQMVTTPEIGPYIERLLGLRREGRLSPAALETLAIIACQQPITRGRIEALRGVNPEGAVAALKGRGLIQAVGRGSGPGRPLLYGTTMAFLEQFGLEQPQELASLLARTTLEAAEEPGACRKGDELCM
ncbi:MAG TPA: SMC-Scp complex subunit ScpB [Dehalococcoidia bacterium]|nr:SMC-Scp complex subunit ScpB [Dehalococcoidia bacterium]HLB29850.1 SMC-Scp complex subunit ScpB [Dehalococcoidia bacterium]HLE01974.1 SMC-Scp complex subunit ScpB [Dehalococcoidia bacterium]